MKSTEPKTVRGNTFGSSPKDVKINFDDSLWWHMYATIYVCYQKWFS